MCSARAGPGSGSRSTAGASWNTDSRGSAGPRAAVRPPRGPHLGIVVGPVTGGGRTVQHVAVDVLGAEMLERAGHRLRDLGREIGRGIVGQPVVLAPLVCELRLQKELGTRDDARA